MLHSYIYDALYQRIKKHRLDHGGNQEEHIYYFRINLNCIPEDLTNEASEIVWECSYQLWDKAIQKIALTQIQHKLRFQGQYLDRKIGLHYNTFRYCDRDIGRFIQPDLIGFLVGINLYQFDRLGLMHGEVIVLSIL